MAKESTGLFDEAFGGARERMLFLGKWARYPLRTGALFPSAAGLADLVAENLPDTPDAKEGLILELGAGTGAVSMAIARRVPQERMVLVEIDEGMCDWVQKRLPGARVIHGDVANLRGLVGNELAPGGVKAVVSGLPVLKFPSAAQHGFVDDCFALMGGDGCLLQYTFAPFAPLPRRRLGLKAERLGVALGNVPPLFLWRFTRGADSAPEAHRDSAQAH